jgi:hypothetical protein
MPNFNLQKKINYLKYFIYLILVNLNYKFLNTLNHPKNIFLYSLIWLLFRVLFRK